MLRRVRVTLAVEFMLQDVDDIKDVAVQRVLEGISEIDYVVTQGPRVALLTKHGHNVNGKVSSEKSCWDGMMARCYRSNNISFPWYGARGIKVCERWHVFENFLEDMGYKPDGRQLDRRNSDGDYTPDNCVWSTRKEQARNRRSTKFLVLNGERRCMAEWAEVLDIPIQTIVQRKIRGWTDERILTTPANRRS